MPKTGRYRKFGLLGDEGGLSDGGNEGSAGSRLHLSGSFKAPITSKSPNKLQSLFSPFSKQTQDQTNQLIDLLNQYTSNNLPSLPSHISRGRPFFDPSTLALEDHWTDIVSNHSSLSKAQREQQEAIWELLSTEVEYIKKLRVIIDLFYSCLVNIQSNQLLTHIETDKIFSNICDVFYSTTHFWNIHLSQVLRNSRETKGPLDPCLLKSGFQVFDRIFEPYVKYCLDQDQSRRYIKGKKKSDESFRLFVNWAESQPQCSRLSLTDLLVRPFQRLTKYALLLSALKKPLFKMEAANAIEQQKKDIVKMVEQVESFVLHVNRLMRQRQDHLLISSMISRIDSYDVVDVPSDECSKVVDQFCKLDLLMPLPGCALHETRNLLFEGNLKLKDTYTKLDVYCFLFTDMILITKPTAKRGDKVKVIKPPMRLDKIIVQSMRDVASFMLLYLNEYSMAQAVYTFHGDSKQWLARVTKAQRDYTAKKLSSPIRSIDPQTRFETSSHKKLFETSSLNLDKLSLVSDRRFETDTGSSSNSNFHHSLSPSLSSFTHSCKKLDAPSSSYHHHSFMSFSNISDDSNDKMIDEKRQRTQKNRKILESDDDLNGSDKEYSLKDAKKISIVSTSSIDLSSLKGSYSDLSKLKKEDKLKLKLSPAKDVTFRIKTHKKNPSDPIIMRTCQSVANLSIRNKCEEYPKIILKNNDFDGSMFSSDPSIHSNIELISADEYEKLHTLTYCKSETSLADSYKKRNKLYFQHKPFKDMKVEDNESVITEKNTETYNTISPAEKKNLDVHKSNVHRSSTSDSNDEFFETIKECNEERDFKDTLNKTLDKHKGIDDENKGCEQISAVIINISNEDTRDNNSHCDTPPDDEFHMCFSPEDLKHLRPDTLEKKKSNNMKTPSAVIVVEAASQTSIDLLISGYWAATSANTTEPSSNQYNNHYRTVSLPNIFDVLPSACCALNSLIHQNDQSNISLIQTS